MSQKQSQRIKSTNPNEDKHQVQMTSEIMAVYLDAPVSNRQAANITQTDKPEQKYHWRV